MKSRLSAGSSLTDYKFTGQRKDDDIGLYFYNARWYDPALGRFTSPDSIVSSLGEGNNPNVVGYVAKAHYSPLVVDYHEIQFLEWLNQENRDRLENPDFRMPTVPINPLAFDRYAYTFNNPIRYSDLSGHCPFCIVVVIGSATITIGAAEMLALGAATVIFMDAVLPGRDERHAAAAAELEALTEQVKESYTEVGEGLVTISQKDLLPKTGEFPYNPPKQKGSPPYVRSPQGGFRDIDGNIWVRDHSGHYGGDHWDVEHPDGSHTIVDDEGNLVDEK